MRRADLQQPDLGEIDQPTWAATSASSATPCVSGRAPATATAARRCSQLIRRGRPPRYSGSSDAIPRSLKSWITLRTCDSSVIHIAAICGTELPTFEATKIAARSRVAKCLASLARRLSRRALLGRKRSDEHLRGTHHHLPDRDASPFATAGEFPVKPSRRAS